MPTKIPKYAYKVKSNIVFTVGLALFSMLFTVIYAPTYSLGGERAEVVALWYAHQNLCLPISCAIILTVTALSRTLMLLFTRTSRLHEGGFLMWQLCEVALTSLFGTLFLSLYLHLGYFTLLPGVLSVYFSVAVFPYTVYWLLMERIDRDQRIALAQRTIISLRNDECREDDGNIRFADDKGTVKLMVGSHRVISIESAGNYVNILYENNGKLVRYSLRNTLKGIEQLCDSHALVRCHRSYYINLSKVKLIRRKNDGIYAEIDVEGVDDIPVSKSYAADVMQRFSDKR